MGVSLVIGIGLVIVAIVVIFLFTNIFDLARPGVNKVVNSTENAASNVQGKDVISGVKSVTSEIKNVTSQIKIKNPYP
jgi:hypothetical protein